MTLFSTFLTLLTSLINAVLGQGKKLMFINVYHPIFSISPLPLLTGKHSPFLSFLYTYTQTHICICMCIHTHALYITYNGRFQIYTKEDNKL